MIAQREIDRDAAAAANGLEAIQLPADVAALGALETKCIDEVACRQQESGRALSTEKLRQRGRGVRVMPTQLHEFGADAREIHNVAVRDVNEFEETLRGSRRRAQQYCGNPEDYQAVHAESHHPQMLAGLYTGVARPKSAADRTFSNSFRLRLDSRDPALPYAVRAPAA